MVAIEIPTALEIKTSTIEIKTLKACFHKLVKCKSQLEGEISFVNSSFKSSFKSSFLSTGKGISPKYQKFLEDNIYQIHNDINESCIDFEDKLNNEKLVICFLEEFFSVVESWKENKGVDKQINVLGRVISKFIILRIQAIIKLLEARANIFNMNYWDLIKLCVNFNNEIAFWRAKLSQNEKYSKLFKEEEKILAQIDEFLKINKALTIDKEHFLKGFLEIPLEIRKILEERSLVGLSRYSCAFVLRVYYIFDIFKMIGIDETGVIKSLQLETMRNNLILMSAENIKEEISMRLSKF